jgi:uncharacterized protein (DUF1684 family)
MKESIRRAFLAAVVAAMVAVAACGKQDGPSISSVPDDFWVKREASYRDDSRGPFTAIRADYLKRGESLTLHAAGDSVGRASFAGADSIAISLRQDGTFEAPGAASLEDLRLGRFLISVDMQTPELGRVLVYDPMLLESRFHGFPVFPHDAGWRVEARAERGSGDSLVVGTTRGLEKALVRSAVLRFERDGVPCSLTGFREPGEAGALFVPFRDATSGEESYGVGRYLRVDWKDGDASAIVDFNHATNPWCAYSDHYNCVLPPEENHLKIAVRAGEKAPPGGAH